MFILRDDAKYPHFASRPDIFKRILEDESTTYEIQISALPNLCDLLLMEYRLDNDSEIFAELNHYIAKLSTIAEKQHSYIVFCETFLLQARLALLNFDVKSARLFLTQAQKIAESYSMKRLAMKISFEHDELLKQLDTWENLKESNSPMPERLKLAGLDEQMQRMIKKRQIDVPELSDEEPVLLLIVSEGGIPFFSQSFIEDKAFEDHLFGGFFTTLNSFISDKFEEGLDRASFGKHTLLMNSITPFLLCYVYKGQSYTAQNRMNLFINKLKSNKKVWKSFENSYRMNKKIKIDDIPELEPLISKIFLEKVIP